MARYFTLAEAEELLPAIERYIRQAQSMREDFERADSVVRKFNRNVAMSGGSFVNLNRAHALRDQRESSLKRLQGIIESLTDSGCQLKDLDKGLIDFPTLYQGEEVLLCWKLGESGIRYWHGLEEGYQGRKEIDDHFRANHNGGEEVDE